MNQLPLALLAKGIFYHNILTNNPNFLTPSSQVPCYTYTAESRTTNKKQRWIPTLLLIKTGGINYECILSFRQTKI